MPDFYTQITMLAPPTAPNHIPRMQDVQALYDARFKDPVRLASPDPLLGSYDPSGKTLTAAANAALTVDGVPVTNGDRILLTAQTAGFQNGIYVATDAGSSSTQWVLTRSDDFDESSKIYSAVKVTVAEGATNDNATFVLATDPPIVLDSTALSFITAALPGTPPSLREYVGSMGSGDPAAKTITHALGTRNVSVDIYRAVDGLSVVADVTRPNANAIVVTFAEPPTESFVVLVRAES
jgi:hypothetical protein